MFMPMKFHGKSSTLFGYVLQAIIALHLQGMANAQTNDIHGLPYYQTFTNQDYPGDQQMFDAEQWHDGSMLFANAGGLVQYADDEWRIFARLEATFISEIEVGKYDNKILWSGSYGNIGVFTQLENGEFKYTSLSDKVPEGFRDYGETFSITETSDAIYYSNDLYVFEYIKAENTINPILEIEYNGTKSATPRYIYQWGERLLAFLDSGSVLEKVEDKWVQLDVDGVQPEEVLYIEQRDDHLLIGDLEKGVLVFDGESTKELNAELNDFFINGHITDIVVFKNGAVAIATYQAGVVLLDANNEFKYIFNDSFGFNEDSFTALHIDEKQDLWLIGSIESITHIYLSNPVRHYTGEVFGFDYSLHAKWYNDKLYVAAFDALHRFDILSRSIETTAPANLKYSYGTEAVFWNFLEVENTLWVGSGSGVYRIQGDELIPIVEGVRVRQLRYLSADIILLVTYNGLDWIQKINGIWRYQGTIDAVNEMLFELAADFNNEFWAGGTQGVLYRGELDTDAGVLPFSISKYSVESGLPKTDNLEPTLNGGKVWVNSKDGFYQFNRQRNSFDPVESINSKLGDWGEYLRMDATGTLWTAYADAEGYQGIVNIVPDEESEWKVEFTPFEISPHHFGDFIEIDGQDLWVGSTEAVIYMDVTSSYEANTPEARLWGITSLFDQKELTYSSLTSSPINYDQKNVELNFVSSSFYAPTKNQFRFKVENEPWSEWRSESDISLNPFFPGQKEISVQTRDFMFVESEPKVFTINILAPWYLSNFAYLIYTALFIGIFISAVRWVAGYRIQQQMKDIKLREIERIIELDEVKTKLLINISHELRTPLTLVTGPVKQLLDSDKIEDDFLLHKLQVAHRNGRRLHDLVEQVLDLSRLDSNIVQFNPAEIPLQTFIQRVTESFEAAIEKKSLNVSINLPESEISFQADADKLEKILINLISNAIKFTPVKGRIVLNLIDLASEIQIEVTDTGRGIESKDIDHVFDRFHSTSDQLEGGGQGIGVGLSITKEFVDLHDGRITVKSESGKGTTFNVILPKKEYEEVVAFIEEPNETSGEVEKKSIQLSVNGKEFSALVVEDNPDMREYVSELLSQSNIRVEQAENGIEGKKQMSLLNPDIVISDIMMPEMNGFEFAQWMRSVPEHKQIPIILLSARSEVEDKVHGFQLGVSDYLTKPFNAQELQARVDNLLVLKKERETAVLKGANEEQTLSADSELVQQLQEFVEGHLDQSKITVDELANHVAMSVRNLQRLLKEITGFSPNEFIREIRLFAARDLLETKQKRSISEVAYSVGFSTPAYFTKQYKKRFGSSPSSYF